MTNFMIKNFEEHFNNITSDDIVLKNQAELYFINSAPDTDVYNFLSEKLYNFDTSEEILIKVFKVIQNTEYLHLIKLLRDVLNYSDLNKNTIEEGYMALEILTKKIFNNAASILHPTVYFNNKYDDSFKNNKKMVLANNVQQIVDDILVCLDKVADNF